MRPNPKNRAVFLDRDGTLFPDSDYLDDPSKIRVYKGVIPALKKLRSRGWKIIGAGAGIVIVGFIVLTFTDPAGQNWASNLSPFLILGGYGVIAAGILKK